MALWGVRLPPGKSQTPNVPLSLFEPFRQAQGPEPVERAMEDTANPKEIPKTGAPRAEFEIFK